MPPTSIYDRRLGWLLGTRILRLTHVGRGSGRMLQHRARGRRSDRCGTPEFFLGLRIRPRSDWLRNLDAGGLATVTVRRRSFPTDHRRLSEA